MVFISNHSGSTSVHHYSFLIIIQRQILLFPIPQQSKDSKLDEKGLLEAGILTGAKKIYNNVNIQKNNGGENTEANI